MKKLTAILVVAVLLVGASSFQTWRVSTELKKQKAQMEMVAPMIALSRTFPDSYLVDYTQVEKVYVAQIEIEGGSNHLVVFIGGQWFDLGEGQMMLPSDNQTGGR